MRKIIFLLLSLVSCSIAYADPRGETFEKDGVVYTIASEYFCRVVDEGSSNGEKNNKKDSIVVINGGEVFVTGVTVSDSVVVIPPYVEFFSTFCKKDLAKTTYNVLGIGERAFEGARLKALVLPYGLKFIGKAAFRNMELSCGVLALPPVRILRADVFDGLKAKVVFLQLEDQIGQNKIPIIFDKTFQITDNLPEFYVSHSEYNVQTNGLDKRNLYTIGKNVFNKWVGESYTFLREFIPRSTSITSSATGKLVFGTCGGISAPSITIQPVRKYQKVGSDIDMLLPYEYVCRNPFTNQTDTYEEFTMNVSLFRCKKGDKYYYFTLDGKPITNTESLIDDLGQDPFGLQVRSLEEVKAKKVSKERESNLNEKVKDLKNLFGF